MWPIKEFQCISNRLNYSNKLLLYFTKLIGQISFGFLQNYPNGHEKQKR